MPDSSSREFFNFTGKSSSCGRLYFAAIALRSQANSCQVVVPVPEFEEVSFLHRFRPHTGVLLSNRWLVAREPRGCEANALFVMIGADPNTAWLPAELERDPKRYICTGRDLTTWKLERA